MLTADQIAQFHRDGFLIIRGLIKGKELSALQQASDKVMAEGLAGVGQHAYHTRPDGKKMYFRSENMWSRDPIFRASTVNPALLECIGQCYGHPFLPVNDSFVCKVPYGDVPINWHQDPPYGFMSDPPAETFEIPNFDTDIYLDASTIENGCVWGIPGKHLVGHVDLSKYSQEELFDKGAVPMVMEPGDVLFHCLSAPHGSVGNKTGTTRRIFYVHYMPLEVLSTSYAMWPDKQKAFSSEGIEEVRKMIADRKAAGYGDLNGSRMELHDDGFVFKGDPTTPARYWRKLIDAMPEDVKRRKRALEVGA